MDYQGLLSEAQALCNPLMLVRWSRAASGLADDGSPEAAEMLAKVCAYVPMPGQATLVYDALGRLRTPQARLKAWSCWLAWRSDRLASALAGTPPELPCPIGLYVLSRLKIGETDALAAGGKRDIAQHLVLALSDQERQIAGRAHDLLRRLVNDPVTAEVLALAQRDLVAEATAPAAIQAVCQVWDRTRSAPLARLMKRRGFSASVLSALKVQGTASGPASEVVRATVDRDPEVARAALRVLQSHPEWLREVCEAVVDEDCAAALRQWLARQASAPADAARRAIYFLVTDQWDRAIDLDFDGTLLSSAYRTGEPALRRRIAAAVRRSRRPDLGRVLMRRHDDNYRHLMMPDPEWEALLAAFDTPERADDLWSLLLDAPPRWSVHAFHVLRRMAWVPPADDAPLWDRLSALGAVPPDWGFLDTGQEAVRYPRPEAEPRHFGAGVYAVAVGGRVHVHRCRDGEALAVLPTTGTPETWSPDGRRLVVERGFTTEVWDWSSATMSATVEGASGEALLGGDALIGRDRATGLRQYWDLRTRRSAVMQTARDFDHAALSPDGRLLAVARSSEWRLYSVDLDRAVDVFMLSRVETWQSSIQRLGFSPDGRWLLVQQLARVELHDLETGASRRFEGRTGAWTFTPDGNLVFTLGGTVVLYDFRKPATLASRTVPPGMVLARLTLDRDGHTLIGVPVKGPLLSWSLCSTPLAAAPSALRTEAERQAATSPQWAWLAAVLGYRARYDIEIAEAPSFVASADDIEIEMEQVT